MFFNSIYIVPTALVTQAIKSLDVQRLYTKILHFILVFFQKRTPYKVSVKKINTQFKTETIISESLTLSCAKTEGEREKRVDRK